MLSQERRSFDVSIDRLECDDPYAKVSMHFLMPESPVPLHCSNLVGPGSMLSFDVGSTVFGVLTLRRMQQQQRMLFVPDVNHTQHFELSGAKIILHLSSHDSKDYRAKLRLPKIEILKDYIMHELQVLKGTQPVDKRLEKTHSVFWEFPLVAQGSHLKVYVPYSALACRGDVLVNDLTIYRLKDIQAFFLREAMGILKASGVEPSSFMQISKTAVDDQHARHGVYIHIANIFSELVHKHIKYMPDYVATGKKDYIGITEFDNYLYSDCEDMAQAAYDLMRIFRKIYPSSKSDLLRGTTTFCYHISAWLTEAQIGIVQGTIGEPRADKLGSHVWCMIQGKQCRPVFVEGTTGTFEPQIYRYAIRYWSRDASKQIRDYFLVDPKSGKYGMPASFLLSSEEDLIEAWAYKFYTPAVHNELHFVANMQIDTFNLLNYILKQ